MQIDYVGILVSYLGDGDVMYCHFDNLSLSDAPASVVVPMSPSTLYVTCSTKYENGSVLKLCVGCIQLFYKGNIGLTRHSS